MEAFSLLKYWRGSGASSAGATSNATITNATESDEEGPFFDMEFTVDGDEKAVTKESDDESDDCNCDNDDGELNVTLSSASSGDGIDPNISLSPSDDLFFKGRLVPLTEPEPEAASDQGTNAKAVSKSATKLRVLMLKLKKSTKLNVSRNEDVKHSSKLTVKFKVEEVPVLSIFARDNSSKASNTKTIKENPEKSSTIEEEEDKMFSKDMVNKYLKKVKPLYFRVSKRYGEKLGLSLAGTGAPKVSELSQVESTQLRNVKSQKQGISFPGKLRVVRKQLGKSKSASSTVTAAADSPPVAMVAKRRDDSLLQQQDGIQSAILHCKRSFKASRGKFPNHPLPLPPAPCMFDLSRKLKIKNVRIFLFITRS